MRTKTILTIVDLHRPEESHQVGSKKESIRGSGKHEDTVEHPVHHPIHYNYGSAGACIVYHDDEGKWVKLANWEDHTVLTGEMEEELSRLQDPVHARRM